MIRLYLFIVILTLATFITGNIYADTTYTIKKGDNPYKIAKKFKVRTQDIIKVNNLRPANLKPGIKITIPSNKKGAPKKNKLAQKKDKVNHTESSHTLWKMDNPPTPPLAKGGEGGFNKGGLEGDFKKGNRGFSGDNIETVKRQEDSLYHVVKRGDTLFFLSKKYSISIDELKEINNLRSKKLRIGRKLLVKRTEPRNYTVEKGDNIWKIAKKFNIDPDELMDINNLETNLLKPGQKILLEPVVEVAEIKNHEAILSQPHIEDEIKKASESEDPGLKELSMKERLILFAKKLLGIPYRFGESSLLGIDCSAYVQKVYSLIGINLPRSAREQFSEGNPVDKEELSIGDLVFFRTYASFPSHVGIYLGNNLFIHASSRGKKVTIDSLETPYYFKRFIGAKRLIEGEVEEKGEPQKKG
ncbi:MAG: LysM peptidoglycan-binding domain-containing protein [Nitrospirota bacterium]